MNSEYRSRAEALSPAERESLLHTVMARQASLSLKVAAVFVAILIGLPLVNWLAPELANKQVFGFSLTWLVLGVLFYPITWVLSKVFIDGSDKIEAELAAEHGEANR
jgi:uncharacterized membrane protein (DUF485 family)